ncbi:hypothetical protein [Photobacterium atrarenae]|uniref:ATPase n=1 Tax=Photobacterium atrarenae TaxID=865757 RepID=A0ABY5GHE9_9GAMM|nr:hypothetical protein [Photobacterium atrarenae]UTV28703.1 hypothetical protein NNL38_05500 [Photobacterium atrarenae]
MKQIGKAACCLCLAALLSACSSTPEGEEGVSSQINAEDRFQQALSVHQQWQQRLVAVSALEVYSPEQYGVLTSSWQKASTIFQELKETPSLAFESYSLFSSQTYLDRYFEEISRVSLALETLQDLKTVADDVLAPAITQLNYLNSIDARHYYRSEYVRLTRLYAKLFRLVEENELSEAGEEQEEFLERGHSLEVRTIKKIYVAPQEEALAVLRRDDVQEDAPISYARVESEILNAKGLIERSPRAFEQIEQAVAEIRFELAHAAHIAQEVQALRGRSDDEYENHFLEIETKLLQISLALNDSDLRDRPLKMQAAQIKEVVSETRQQYAAASQVATPDPEQMRQLVALRQQVSAQQAQIQALQAQLARAVAAGSSPVETNFPSGLTAQPSISQDAGKTARQPQDQPPALP